MGYTPVELRHVSVRRRLFGYDRRSVQQIFDEVAESFETVWRDRGELADKVEALELEAEELRKREQALANTLVSAERVADEVRQQAKREAALIMTEARCEARDVVRRAEDDRERLRSEVLRIEALLRSALGIVGDVAVIAEAGVSGATAAPLASAHETESDTSTAQEPSAPDAAASQPADAPQAPGATEAEAEAEDAPGWPPLRQVAQGSSRFDWGD